MKALVTGCAGFIGSMLTDRLLIDGIDVIGIDRLSDYYPREVKENNLSLAMQNPQFEFWEQDIAKMDSFPKVDYVFHLAAQAGVRVSWGKKFDLYIHDNILTTQRLLEYYKDKNLRKFIFSSSSSVYGDSDLPLREDQHLHPISPYGVTKLAAEHLCYLYWKNFGIPSISLRYFTVYGPRQRPDMAIHKFIKAILGGIPVTIYGNGSQTRDFTYVDDVVEANIISAFSDVEGEIFNIGGGNRISVNDLIANIEMITKKEALLNYIEDQKGDVKDTWSDTKKAEKKLGWHAKTELFQGLRKYITWIEEYNGH